MYYMFPIKARASELGVNIDELPDIDTCRQIQRIEIHKSQGGWSSINLKQELWSSLSRTLQQLRNQANSPWQIQNSSVEKVIKTILSALFLATTEVTGVITMWCCDGLTAEKVLLSDVKFWLNQTSAWDPGLQEQGDITAIEFDHYKIMFALTRQLEGYYTCSKRIDENRVQLESNPKALISK